MASYYLCIASNAAGHDSISVSLWVHGVPAFTQNRSSWFSSEVWCAASGRAPVNAKTLVNTVLMGFVSFLSSVAVCFIFMFFWSQSKGNIKTEQLLSLSRAALGQQLVEERAQKAADWPWNSCEDEPNECKDDFTFSRWLSEDSGFELHHSCFC